MTAAVWSGPAATAAALLVLAGMAKCARPDATARGLRETGLRVGRNAVRSAAAVEIVVGFWALAWSGPLANLAVAVSYLGFATFVAVALARRSPIASCGCFGQPDTPPTQVHLGIDVGAAVVALAAAVTHAPRVSDVVGDQPLAGVPFVALMGLAVATAVAALTLLPRLRAITTGTQR